MSTIDSSFVVLKLLSPFRIDVQVALTSSKNITHHNGLIVGLPIFYLLQDSSFEYIVSNHVVLSISIDFWRLQEMILPEIYPYRPRIKRPQNERYPRRPARWRTMYRQKHCGIMNLLALSILPSKQLNLRNVLVELQKFLVIQSSRWT